MKNSILLLVALLMLVTCLLTAGFMVASAVPTNATNNISNAVDKQSHVNVSESPQYANLYISPSSLTLTEGEIFEVDIMVDASTQEVDYVEVYVTYSARDIKIVDGDGNIIEGSAEGVIIPGEHSLTDVLYNRVDNNVSGDLGYADITCGMPQGGTPEDRIFTLATVRFKAITESAGNKLLLESLSPRFSRVYRQGIDVTGTCTGTNILIPPTGHADLYISPSGQAVAIGQIFEVDIMVDATDQEVWGLDARLNFNPSYIRAVDADGNIIDGMAEGIIVPGESTLIDCLVNRVDNDNGYVDISSNMGPDGTPADGIFVLGTVRFKAISPTGSTAITFNTTLPRETLVDTAGFRVTGTLTGGSVTVLVLPGDANGDGMADAVDITKMKRVIALLDSPTPGADANGDGNVNALDITKLELIIAGMD